ncbi:sugar transporter ERD6-like 6 [Lathyrus oleraceus]|uniref:sugar transporter ERD6-like 6 n=1 Tax=Pisum sativum TaxID=3888 RepID=UPI0021D36B61|nr:sugar transporter ERD6-like 6 [Pisum sativum]
MDVHVGQSNKSQPCLKHGRQIGSKDKNPLTRKGAKNKDCPSEDIENLKESPDIINTSALEEADQEYISPDSDLYATLSLVSVAGVVVMVIAFSLGLGAMPWIIMSEILPINIKDLAGSFATLANWFFSWLVTLTTNLLLDWSSGECCEM